MMFLRTFSSSAALVSRSVPKRVPSPRSVTSLSKIAYIAKAEASGPGRDGQAKLREEGPLKFNMSLPKSLGGSSEGNNPEQLFALGYSSCFLSALHAVARSKPYTLPNDTEVHADVSIGTPEGAQGFGLAVNLLVKGSFEASDRSALEEIAHEAHQKCPYSKATRNNIPVTVSVATY